MVSDRDERTGWDRWHSEFNGFVGRVEFISPEPDKLPWSTDKTDVDRNNASYRTALQDMRKFNEEWRSFTELRKKPAFTFRQLPAKLDSKKEEQESRIKEKKEDAGAAASPHERGEGKRKIEQKTSYQGFREILPKDIDEKLINDKLLVIVHEAKALDLAENVFCGMALIRMLFEMSVMLYVHRNEKYDELKAASITRRKQKVSLTLADEKNLIPNFGEILAYLDANPSTWGAKENHLKHSLKLMIKHQSVMNSAVHNPFQTFNAQKAFEIRDDSLPLFRHLLET